MNTDPVIIPSTTDYLRDLAGRIATPSDGIRLKSIAEVLEAMDDQARAMGDLPVDWRDWVAQVNTPAMRDDVEPMIWASPICMTCTYDGHTDECSHFLCSTCGRRQRRNRGTHA